MGENISIDEKCTMKILVGENTSASILIAGGRGAGIIDLGFTSSLLGSLNVAESGGNECARDIGVKGCWKD